MKYKIIFCWILVISMTVENVKAQTMRIDKDGMALINGKRTFILGIYENPKEDKVLKEISESGFNMVRVTMQDSSLTNRTLDRLATYKLGAWIRGDFDLSRDTEIRKQKLKAMVHDFGSHPALRTWEMPDEPLWNLWMEAWQYRTVKEIKLLMKEITEVKDSTKRMTLENKVKAITSLYNDAEFVKGQQTADLLWKELGGEPPSSKNDINYDISATFRKGKEMALGLKNGYDFVKTLDPNHPILMTHAPRNLIGQLASFSKAADIIACDVYPVPEYSPYVKGSDVKDQSLSAVGVYTKRMQQAAPGKPVWMVLQGFGWGDYRTELSAEIRKQIPPPTLKQTRFMAYDAIVHGAKGISYWGTYVTEKNSQLWKDILTIVHELADLQPILSSKDANVKLSVNVEETFNSLDRTVQILPKQVGSEIYIIVVNENEYPLPYYINKLNGLNGITYVDVFSGKQSIIANGGLRFSVGGQRVQLLKPLSR